MTVHNLLLTPGAARSDTRPRGKELAGSKNTVPAHHSSFCSPEWTEATACLRLLQDWLSEHLGAVATTPGYTASGHTAERNPVQVCPLSLLPTARGSTQCYVSVIAVRLVLWSFGSCVSCTDNEFSSLCFMSLVCKDSVHCWVDHLLHLGKTFLWVVQRVGPRMLGSERKLPCTAFTADDYHRSGPHSAPLRLPSYRLASDAR